MYIKTVLTTFSAALFMGGCGGGGSDKGLSFDATVNYKKAATYDMRNYMIPLENSINIYDSQKYKNNDGKKRFKGDPDRSTYTEKYDINGTKVIVRDGRDEIDTQYEIRADRILEIDDDTNSSAMEIARFVDTGDYLLVRSVNSTEDNIPVVHKIACKVNKHLDSKKIDNVGYSDVLEVSCKTNIEGSNNGSSITLQYKDDGSDTAYFANGIGLIYSEDISCSDLTSILNGQEQHNTNCEKEIDTLISHNKL